jgi:hypothetical protein
MVVTLKARPLTAPLRPIFRIKLNSASSDCDALAAKLTPDLLDPVDSEVLLEHATYLLL